jgi:hypothetical protein
LARLLGSLAFQLLRLAQRLRLALDLLLPLPTRFLPDRRRWLRLLHSAWLFAWLLRGRFLT